MPLFSRRTLQALLIKNSDILSIEQQRRFANSLNSSAPKESLSAQWELVFLDVFRNLGRVTYEPILKGNSRPDLIVRLNGLTGSEFVVEVTAVSDKYLRTLNPLDEFEKEFRRVIRKADLPVRGFHLEIDSKFVKLGKSEHVVLAIPKRSESPDFFDSRFKRFLASIKDEPGSSHSIERRGSGFNIRIDYSPTEQHMSAHYGGYDSDLWSEETSVYKALVKKYRQIKDSGFEGPAGIVVCDAGAPVFRQKKSYNRLTMKEVAEDFLKSHPRVSFIVSAAAFPRLSLTSISTRLEVGIFTSESAYFLCGEDLVAALSKIESMIPKLQTDARHAKRVLEALRGSRWLSYEGDISISWRRENGVEVITIKMSARSLIDLLGEQQSFDLFLKRNRLKRTDADPNAHNPFSDVVRLGDRLESVRFIRSEDDDDDWIEFEFRGKDAAIAGIQVEDPMKK